MKSLIATCLILSLASVTLAQKGTKKYENLNSGGVINGGGGAGVVVNGRFQTLASMGLKFNDEEPLFEGPTLSDLNFILNLIDDIAIMEGKRDKLFHAIFGPDRKYIKVSVVDPKLFNKLQAEYKPFAAQYPGKFGVAAITNGNTTYLLPSFFEMTWRSQALLLIHEAIYSLSWNYKTNTPGVELKDILRLDVAIYTLLKENYDRLRGGWRAAYAFYKLGIPSISPKRVEVAAQLFALAGEKSFGSTTIFKDTVFTGNEPYIVNAASIMGPTAYEVIVGLRVIGVGRNTRSKMKLPVGYAKTVSLHPSNNLWNCFLGETYPEEDFLCISE